MEKSDIFFLIFAQNIDCRYTLEPSTHDLCLRIKVRKIMYTPVNPCFTLYISRECYHYENSWFLYFSAHYENMPLQYFTIFHSCKNEKKIDNKTDNFLIFAQNIDCGYTLGPPQ